MSSFSSSSSPSPAIIVIPILGVIAFLCVGGCMIAATRSRRKRYNYTVTTTYGQSTHPQPTNYPQPMSLRNDDLESRLTALESNNAGRYNHTRADAGGDIVSMTRDTTADFGSLNQPRPVHTSNNGELERRIAALEQRERGWVASGPTPSLERRETEPPAYFK